MYGEMNRMVAALHRVDYEAVGLDDYGKSGNKGLCRHRRAAGK
jgi:hypothetical protein